MELAPQTINIDASSISWNPQPIAASFLGVSIEPNSVTEYAKTDLLRNLFDSLGRVPPIRLGGIMSDHTLTVPDLNQSYVANPNITAAEFIYIREDWYDLFNEYYHPDTQWTYTLNFGHTDNDFGNATYMQQWAETKLNPWAWEAGNEIDHYYAQGYRDEGWDVAQYIPQFNEFVSKFNSSLLWQAAVFADPPDVPSQHDEIDDFSIVNLTKTGFNRSLYSVHLYPQSNCDAGRVLWLSLDLLSSHETIWTNLSQYIPQVDAAKPGTLVLGETNSVSCSGKSGISDTFGAALWTVDYALTALTIGLKRVYFHLGHESDYSPFIPLTFEKDGQTIEAGMRANWYGFHFLSWLGSNTSDSYSISSLTDANYTDLSGYAITTEDNRLEQLVFIDLGVWNTSESLSNPSTYSGDDSSPEYASNGSRPTYSLQLSTEWDEGTDYQVFRLTGPGTNAKSNVSFAGLTVNNATGKPEGALVYESGTVGENGMVNVTIDMAQAILVNPILSGKAGQSNDTDSNVSTNAASASTSVSGSISPTGSISSSASGTASGSQSSSNAASAIAIGSVLAIAAYLL